MEEFAIPIFHHGGHFVRDNKGFLVYIEGKVEKFPKMDIDLICFFDLQTLFKCLGYLDYKAMYWFDPTAPDLENGLHLINGDLEINQLRENILKNKDTEEFYLYFDHPIMVTPVEDVEMDIDIDADVEEDSSDDGYETTEDEPYKPPPQGFEEDSSDSDCVIVKKQSRKVCKKIESVVEKKSLKMVSLKKKASTVDNRCTGGPSSRPTVGTKKSAKAKYNGPIGARGPKSPGPISARGPKFSRSVGAKANFKIQKNTAQKGAASTSFGANFGGRGAAIPRSEDANSGEDDEKSAENVDEEDPIFEYESESLLTPNSSEDEKERYEFPQFNDAAGFGEVYFELGMEFATIESFKIALKDHVIYEGRKIRYIKNDQRRVRCDCEHGLERIKKPRKSKGANEASTNNNAEPKSNDANNVQRGDGNDVGTVEGGAVNEEAANVTVETNSVKVVTAEAAGAVNKRVYCLR
ncbi:uncharacterized protein LOC110265593 isoform X2 [Arachis ipaensis]|uniref:uncharacterized protein LOC110265593 isoform X2 n=1 Tax=Arachis ipaensis TaxID=130454 RepID=UPI000A2B1EB8|nr:uncharacterized protein LOC110265593 isoform X2 [Arachis ipaensis]XP_025673835.1 uncharacterized protein LOC112773008 isoform X2 [Arachis hypogaea]